MKTIEIRYKNYGNVDRGWRLKKVPSFSEWWNKWWKGIPSPRYELCVTELKGIFPTKSPITGGVLYISTSPISSKLFSFKKIVDHSPQRLTKRDMGGWRAIGLLQGTRLEFIALLKLNGIIVDTPFYAHFEWDI